MGFLSSMLATGEALPSTGVDLALWIGLGIAAIGAIALAVVGGAIAFKVIKKGLSWVGRAFG